MVTQQNQEITIVPLFDELDPLTFCQGWGLTYEKASEYLLVGARTLAAYASRGEKTHRNPSSRVKALAAKTHNDWVREGRSPNQPSLFLGS